MGTTITCHLSTVVFESDQIAAPGAECASWAEIFKKTRHHRTLADALSTRGIVLGRQDDSQESPGFELLTKARNLAAQARFTMQWAPVIGIHAAKMKARAGDIDGAIEMSRALIDELFASGEMAWRGPATTTLVQLLLGDGGGKERHAAQAAIDGLASVPVDPGFVVYELPLLRLRALLAQARGDDATYREHARCYRAMATSLGFQGHIVLAEAMA